ncbi:MAG: tetratricopeptide repeat protein, partial [Pyrinomonadaceae bacterium]|nr:tetratricopeptide repeat protein [Pyrinomonadaceae bacterium]
MSLDLDLLYSDFNFTMDKSSYHKIYEFENFRLDTAYLMLYRDSEEIPLVPKAVETLLVLVEKRGEILSKDDLMEAIWTDAVVEESNLSKYLHVLRKTLGNQENGKPFIETFRRRGYRFNAKVSVSDLLPEANSEKTNQNFVPLHAPTKDGAIREATTGKVVALADWGRKTEIVEEKSPPVTLPSAQAEESPTSRRKTFLPVAAISLLVLALAFFAFNRFRSEVPVKNAPIKTIGILPFKPLAAENRDEVLEIGMADTLIARLGNNREIIVSPLSSVRKYNNLEQDALQAGRELGVDSVLDGSVQRRDDKIRVNVRLIKVADGNLLWTGTFDEKFTDIFVVQDAISRRVESALALQLSGDEKARLEKRYTNNAEAYEFYLRGRYHFFKLTPPEVRKAIAFYGQAIEADPNYALAFAAMADAYRTMAIAAHASSKEVCPKAQAQATRALEIDESLAEAHVVLGWIGFLYDLDWENAERQLKRAIELAPNNSETHRAYAHLLSSAGRHDEALAESKRARELAPLTLITATLDGYFLLYAGHYDEAIARLNKTLELDPNFWAAHNALGRVYIVLGRYDEAISAIKRAEE